MINLETFTQTMNRPVYYYDIRELFFSGMVITHMFFWTQLFAFYALEVQ